MAFDKRARQSAKPVQSAAANTATLPHFSHFFDGTFPKGGVGTTVGVVSGRLISSGAVAIFLFSMLSLREKRGCDASHMDL